MNITIHNLTKKFGDKTAVCIPEFHLTHNEIVGLVGNNGSGKTTFFRLLTDLTKADTGEVLLNGINPAHSEAWKAHTGVYLDESFLIDYLTPEEYFNFIATVSGIGSATLQQRLQTFESFMNGEIIGTKKLIRNFSAGNKQKIGIIAAMLSTPTFLILDEPFNFLDPSGQNALKQIICNYGKQNNTTVIISSHNLHHTIDISTRIVLLEDGNIINDFSDVDADAKNQLEVYFQ
ncbi:ABC transporter ATP-binding protein [Hoylesella saccharolytica]|uniref:ABC transporter ATP-binding protein n=1 Tax=Hoylesella saccharolytica TaxID=633701 RepID=UPI0028F11E4F|nr:ABC transporter ATP-binding protein [Hoylesella saccharolytica]